jgi:metal-responsive CopG/Arc/MetJ family transcriptional regulator
MNRNNKEKCLRTVIIKIQNSFFEEFTKTCDKNYKTKSEVIKDFMLKYIKENK